MKLLIALEETAVNKKEIKDHKKYIFKEVCELIDDEETMVKIEAL